MYLHRLIVVFFANLLPAPVMSATELQCDVKNGWQPFCNYCYLIPRYQLTWREAEKYCVSQKAHLSSLRSEDEMNFLTRLVTNAEVWSAFLGVRIEWRPKFLFRFTPLFSNADGTTADYFRWNEGEPNYHDEQENCVEVRTDGYLNDCRCDRPQKFICKKAKNVRTPPLTCPICAPPTKCPTPTICAPPTRCPTPVPNTCAPPATCPTPVPTTCAPPVTCPNPVPTTCAPPATCPTPVQTTCAPPVTCPTPVPTTCAPPTTCPTPVPTICAPPTTCPTPVAPTGATSPTLLPLCPILSPAELPTSKPGNVTIFPVLQTPDDVKGPCMLVALPNPQFYGFVVDLLGRLSAGRSIAIRGRAKPLAERISFNLITANGIPLHLGFRIKDQTIVMSSNLNGTEDIKEITADPFPFGPEHDFEVIIQCNVNLFNLTVNSALQLDFTNRLCNVQNITALKMWRDLSLTDVRLM